MNYPDRQRIAHEMQDVHAKLTGLVRSLGVGVGPVTTIHVQLDWALQHIHEAIRGLRGERRAPTSAPVGTAARPAVGRLSDGLRGHTRSITLPEILGFVSSLHKTGVLRVNSAEEAFLIQLHEGSVVFAQGDNPPESDMLGEILISQQSLSREDLERVLADESGLGQLLGKRLLEAGAIDAQDLVRALTHQVQRIFHRLFAARDALFQFDEGLELILPDDVRLNVTSLLLECARSHDESRRESMLPGASRAL